VNKCILRFAVVFLLFGLWALCGLFSGCSQEFKTNNQKPKLYYFGATWCGPCVEMKKLFKNEDVKKELAYYNFRMFDYDTSADKAWFKDYKVKLLPTSVFIINNKIVKKQIGKVSKQNLLSLLKKYRKK